MDKINVIKNVLLFLSWAPTHHSFTFNLQFLYELRQKVHLSKIGCGNFHFQYVSFLLQFTFFSNKSMNYLTLKRQNSFQNNNNRKATHSFPPDLWFLRCNKKFENSMISAWDRALQNWHGDEFFKLQTSTFPVCHFFSILTFK